MSVLPQTVRGCLMQCGEMDIEPRLPWSFDNHHSVLLPSCLFGITCYLVRGVDNVDGRKIKNIKAST